jgi:hypothetical protein
MPHYSTLTVLCKRYGLLGAEQQCACISVMDKAEFKTMGQSCTEQLVFHVRTYLGLCTVPYAKLRGRTIGMLRELPSRRTAASASASMPSLERYGALERPELTSLLSFERGTRST